MAASLARRFWVGLRRVGRAIGHVQAVILIAIIVVVVFAPYRALLWVFGRDPARALRAKLHQGSYWKPREETPTPSDYAHQF